MRNACFRLLFDFWSPLLCVPILPCWLERRLFCDSAMLIMWCGRIMARIKSCSGTAHSSKVYRL